MNDVRFAKFVVLVNGAVPLGMLGWDAYRHQLGVNPVEKLQDTTGMLTLIFLMLTLAVTPVRKISGWNWLSNFRRMLGLYAFFYGCLHFLAYFWGDRELNIIGTITDVIHRPFIWLGMLALLAMAPLAATSTNAMIKRLGAARWKMLHRLVYVAGIAAVIHYWMRGKVVTAKPLIFSAVLAVLLGYRIISGYLAHVRKARLAAAAVSLDSAGQTSILK